ncbi:MAG: TIGR01777 family oxidoreductase [Balneolales bacterium]|nr:TIGR01777 family oxidoreductase [Balneolales bacterium]
MKICITGGTGFVGSSLVAFFVEQGHQIVIFSRNPKKKSDKGKIRTVSYDQLESEINGSDVVVNLAGENLFDQRWTDSVKSSILQSRVKTTRSVVQAVSKAENKPKLLISASAVGYYGDRGEEELTESSGAGSDFLAGVCVQWEEEAKKVHTEAPGVRLVLPRIGIVLEKNGGALQKMLTPFSLFVGGPLGDGKQYFPWVHMKDICGGFNFVIKNHKINGPLNFTSPNPVTMKVFAQKLGSSMGRPSLFSVPEFALKMLVGEAASALTASQRSIPGELLENGYEFSFYDLESALKDILK